MADGFVLRSIDSRQAAAVCVLFDAVGWQPRRPPQMGVALDKSLHAVGVFMGQTLVGFGRLVGDGVFNAILYDLVVLPDLRGLGVGKQIVEHCRQWCCVMGVPRMELISTKQAEGFYATLGGTEVKAFYMECNDEEDK